MRHLTTTITTFTIAATFACAAPQKAAAPDDVGVRVGRMLPQAAGLEASKIAVKLELANPRSGPVTISGIEYEVDSGEVAGVLKGTVEGGTVIEASQLTEVEFSQKIPFPKDDEAKYLSILEEGTIPLTVRGRVTFDDGTSANFEKKGAVATPSLPKLVLHDAQAARYGKDGLDVTMYIRLINENVFSITVDSVEYAIAINGKASKSEQGAIGARLVQGAAQEFTASVVMDEEAFPNIKEIMAAGKIEYVVTGKVTIQGIELPIEIPGEIEFATE